MKSKLFTFMSLCVLILLFNVQILNAQSNDSVKTPISQSHIDRAKAKVELMAKDLGLTPEQQELVAGAIARRDFDNSVKTRGLTSMEEKKLLYRTTYLECVATLKAKMPNALVNKIGVWESEYRIKTQTK